MASKHIFSRILVSVRSRRDVKESGDPYTGKPKDPTDEFDDIFGDDPDQQTQNIPKELRPPTTPTYSVVANRSSCPEDEFIIYTITTTNLVNGTVLYYTLSGLGITSDDIIGGNLTGSLVINDNKARVTVGIAEDGS